MNDKEIATFEILENCKIIGITGAAGAGKGSVADYLFSAYGATSVACADPIKEALKSIFGFPISAWNDREWKEKIIPIIGRSPRQLAQTLGTDWGRQFVSADLWISTVISKWVQDGQKLVVVPDVRFDNEALAILRAGGLVIDVARDVAEVAEHVSEAGVSPGFITATISNDSEKHDLPRKVEDALQQAYAKRVAEFEAFQLKQKEEAEAQQAANENAAD